MPKKTTTADQVKINGGAFQPFTKDQPTENCTSNKQPAGKSNNISVPAAATSSTDEKTGGKREEKEGQQTQRKQRRCWSPELHRRFLHALQQLGGSHSKSPLTKLKKKKKHKQSLLIFGLPAFDCHFMGLKLDFKTMCFLELCCSCYTQANQRANEG